MKKIAIIIIVLLVFMACKTKLEDDSKKVSVFVGILMPEVEGKVSVWVNDSLIYKGDFIYGKESEYGNEMLVGKVRKDSSLYKFKVKILDRDTTFNYNMSNVDSIAIGLIIDKNKYFYIRDNSVHLMLD